MTTAADPFAHLEEETTETLAWQREQDAATRATLDEGPARAAFEARLRAQFVGMFDFHAPQPAGGRWFLRGIPAGARQTQVSVAERPGGPARLLFDLASLGNPKATLQAITPTRDGRRLVMFIGHADAAHRVTAHVVDVDSATVTHEFEYIAVAGFASWLPGDEAFLYAGYADPALTALPPAPGLRAHVQHLDGRREVVALPHAHPVTVPMMSADRRYAILCESQVAMHPTWLKRLDGVSEWQPFLDASYGKVKGAVVGEEYIAIVFDGAPRGRLVGIPLRTARDRATWRELLPEGEATLCSVALVAGRLVVGASGDGCSLLRIVGLDGKVERDVDLPSAGAIGKFAIGFILSIMDDLTWVDGDQISFVHSSLTQRPVAYRHDVRLGTTEALTPVYAPLAGAEVVEREARAPDGAAVHYRVLRPKGANAKPLPTIVTGYGGFNVHWAPAWADMAAAWIGAGGAWVHCHFRGGGEFGEDFWRDGRMEKKANTFVDQIAVCEDLRRRGDCGPGQLGIFGSSNGGLGVSAVMARRPDLVDAVLAQVPIVDLIGCARDPMVMGICAADYGDPTNPEQAAWLATYSPYQNLPRGVRYPALLADSGAVDTTCPPWHSRKLVAFAQANAAPGSRPALLRVREGTGHNDMSRDDFIERDAEELAFFARYLGLAVGAC